MIRALVLADTHIRPGRARRLPDAVYRALERVDVVLHAGDVLTQDLLDELSTLDAIARHIHARG